MTPGSFLYYIPGVQKEQITREFVASRPEAVPLFDLVHSPRLFSLHVQVAPIVNRGPDGGAGCIIAGQPVVDVNQKIGYYPAIQTWQKFGDDQWVGYQTDMMPGPASLKRTAMVSGYEVELGDLQVWTAPTIRRADEGDLSNLFGKFALPVKFALNSQMEWSAQPQEQSRELWDISAKILNFLFGGGKPSDQEFIEWFIKCLQVNYRIDAAETSILGLLTTTCMAAVVDAAIDGPLINSLLEAKELAPQNPT